MATYITSSCPHCGHVVRFMAPKLSQQYGSPLRNCPKCGKPYIDKSFVEMVLFSETVLDCSKVSPGSVIRIILGGFIIFGSIVGINDGFFDLPLFLIFCIVGGLLVISGVYSLIKELKNHEKRKEELMKEYLQSKKRLENEEYIGILKNAGII